MKRARAWHQARVSRDAHVARMRRAYGHMVSVESRELVLARRLREALEAWETLAVQLDNALRQDLQDEMAFENLFSLIKQADDIADIDTTDYHKVRRG